MKKVLILLTSILLAACGGGNANQENDGLSLLSKFNSTWNIHETIEQEDGKLIYHAVQFGGLRGSMTERNMPVNWSSYEAVTVEFAEPTKVETQLIVAEKFKSWGKVGITSLTCNFDGQDATLIDAVMLQAAEPTTLVIKDIRLIPATGIWKTIPLRSFNCEFGDWVNGFSLQPEGFADALPGDKLEFIYSTDTSNPEIGDWLIKTVFSNTDSTLEGNSKELNKWKCAPVGKESTVYRITLTKNDVTNLKASGLFVNGRYLNVYQCNLLRKEDIDTSAPQAEF